MLNYFPSGLRVSSLGLSKRDTDGDLWKVPNWYYQWPLTTLQEPSVSVSYLPSGGHGPTPTYKRQLTSKKHDCHWRCNTVLWGENLCFIDKIARCINFAKYAQYYAFPKIQKIKKNINMRLKAQLSISKYNCAFILFLVKWKVAPCASLPAPLASSVGSGASASFWCPKHGYHDCDYYPPVLEHGHPRRLRAAEDPGHGQLRQGDARPAQGKQDPLRHEDIRQTESEYGVTKCSAI